MPCCAFAAFLFSQLVLGVAVIKRSLLGRSAAAVRTNAAVEWRLDPPASTVPGPVTGTVAWGPRPRRLAILALAAAVEAALLLGAVYGVRTHLRHVHHDVAAAGSR